MQKNILQIIFSVILLCSSGQAYAKTINVLTTTADVKSITEFIGGERVKVNSLGKGNKNYHFLAAKPSYMIKAKKADLFIRSGLSLEIGFEALILEGSRNRKIQIGHLDVSSRYNSKNKSQNML